MDHPQYFVDQANVDIGFAAMHGASVVFAYDAEDNTVTAVLTFQDEPEGRFSPLAARNFAAVFEDLSAELQDTLFEVSLVFAPSVNGNVERAFNRCVLLLSGFAATVDILKLSVDLRHWRGPLPAILTAAPFVFGPQVSRLFSLTLQGPCLDWLVHAVNIAGFALDTVEHLTMDANNGHYATMLDPGLFPSLKTLTVTDSPQAVAFVRARADQYGLHSNVVITPAPEDEPGAPVFAVGGPIATRGNVALPTVPLGPFSYWTGDDEHTTRIVEYRDETALGMPLDIDATAVLGHLPDSVAIEAGGDKVLVVCLTQAMVDPTGDALNQFVADQADPNNGDVGDDDEFGLDEEAYDAIEATMAGTNDVALVKPTLQAIEDAFSASLVGLVAYNDSLYCRFNGPAIFASSFEDQLRLLSTVQTMRLHLSKCPNGLLGSSIMLAATRGRLGHAIDAALAVFIACPCIPDHLVRRWLGMLVAEEARQAFGTAVLV